MSLKDSANRGTRNKEGCHLTFGVCYFIIILCRSRIQKGDRLWAGWPSGRSSRSGNWKISLFSTSSRSALVPTQPSLKWVKGVKQLGREADANDNLSTISRISILPSASGLTVRGSSCLQPITVWTCIRIGLGSNNEQTTIFLEIFMDLLSHYRRTLK
jgi:hypothetical protein